MHGRSWRGEGVLFAPKFNTARREQKILKLQIRVAPSPSHQHSAQHHPRARLEEREQIF